MTEKPDQKPSQDTVHILTEVSQAKIVIDPMRREILRLLAKNSLCGKDLSTILHMSAPTVGHHLKSLKHANMITLVRREANPQGMIQKFYLANAKAFIVDTRKLPMDIKRYFFAVDMERVRAAIATAANLRSNIPPPSSDLIERAAQNLRNSVVNVARSYKTSSGEPDPELIIHELYKDAINQLLSNWPQLKS